MFQQQKQLRWSQIRVALIVTLSLSIIFLTILFAGNVEEFLRPKITLHAIFHDVKGLREGAPVWFSGLEIGSVKSLTFLPESGVRVTMSVIPESLKYLKTDSKAAIMTLGLLGDKYIEISPGSKSAKALKQGDTIEGITSTEIQEIVETSQASLSRLTEFIHKLEELITRLEQGQGTVPMLLRDPTLYDNLTKTIAELHLISKQIRQGKGTAGRLISEDSLYKNLSSAASDISLFAKEINKSEGTVKKLIKEPELYNRFIHAASEIESFSKRLNKSRGTLYKLVEDPELYENLNKTSKTLTELLSEIKESEGLMGSFVRDKELAEELKSTLKELNLLIKDIRENPGKYFKFSLF
jgi:phospholipid/cholesterol/gamma-HCH transport system substrate-binding protein